MRENNQDDLYDDTGYRIRCMRSLLTRLREGHAHCNELWYGLEKGPVDAKAEEELQRAICQLREDLNMLKELRQRGIEGVSCGEMKHIEKDLRTMDMNLKMIKRA